MTERARILKIDSDTPAALKTPSGYAAVPREVTRRTELSGQAHKVLTALIGLCYGEDRYTRARLTTIAERCGMNHRTVQRHMAVLLRLKLISRSRDSQISGRPAVTHILCHYSPKNARINLRVLDGDTTRQPCHPMTTTVSPHDDNRVVSLITDSQQTPNRGEAPAAPTPSRNPPPWDSRQQEVIDLATQQWGACNGECFVGRLLGLYPTDLVKEAIGRHWNKVGPGLRPALLEGTCRGMLADGWKPEHPAQRRTGGSVPYKPDGPVPPPVMPLTEEERAALKANTERLMREQRERVKNGRRPKQEE